jgi:hypothetical protein
LAEFLAPIKIAYFDMLLLANPITLEKIKQAP